MPKYYNTAAMTDIHWGAKNNSEQHNQDCLDYIDWFCDNAIEHKVDNIMFLGDWFENRSAVNISTLNFSYRGAKKLNDLGIPVFFVIGNHDLFYRHTRELYSTVQFHEFSNFVLITEPVIINEIETSPLMCPYLFANEYEDLIKYNNVTTWWGHFEFKGFIITGYNTIMMSGPDHSIFDGPKYIFSGHYHKRQKGGNVVYIGNTFPTNFGDVDDNDRGMVIYNHITQQITFLNWENCPKYVKKTLSSLLDDPIVLLPNTRVKCVIDIPITFEESMVIKQQLIDQYSLREFITEETFEVNKALSTTEGIEIEMEENIIGGVDDLVIQMLNSIDTIHIDNELLINLYRRLK